MDLTTVFVLTHRPMPPAQECRTAAFKYYATRISVDYATLLNQVRSMWDGSLFISILLPAHFRCQCNRTILFLHTNLSCLRVKSQRYLSSVASQSTSTFYYLLFEYPISTLHYPLLNIPSRYFSLTFLLIYPTTIQKHPRTLFVHERSLQV